MKLRIVSSKKEITDLNRIEQLVHLAFRASNMDIMNLIQSCPDLQVVQTPPPYHKTMSKAAQQFLEIQGVQLLRGDVWGHRKDIDDYYAIGEMIVGRISNLMEEGNSIEETVEKLQRETKLSEDMIRHILKGAGDGVDCLRQVMSSPPFFCIMPIEYYFAALCYLWCARTPVPEGGHLL